MSLNERFFWWMCFGFLFLVDVRYAVIPLLTSLSSGSFVLLPASAYWVLCATFAVVSLQAFLYATSRLWRWYGVVLLVLGVVSAIMALALH